MNVKRPLSKFFRKFLSWRLWLNLVAMVLVVVGLFFGLRWWLLKYTRHGEGIEVPNLIDKDFRVAQDELEALGLVIVLADSTYYEDKPAGTIVVQSPSAGRLVKDGRMVYVTINSLTVPRVDIPDLAGNSSYRQAKSILERLEFRVLPPKLIDGDKDWVYGLESEGRELHYGDVLKLHSEITLVIGNGSSDMFDEWEDMPLDSIYGQEYDDGGQPHVEDDFEEVDMDDIIIE